MTLLALGLNHGNSPIELRESLAFAPGEQRQSLLALQAATGAEEAVLLSTCNRSEVYLRADGGQALDAADRWLRRRAGERGVDLGSHLYQHIGGRVARHAFRLASGLDSMVVGEPQILGQVKGAVRLAGQAGTLGGSLDRLFQQAFCVAKEVRARTGLGQLSVSVAAAAVGLSRQVFGDIGRLRVLFVGAGEMIELAATHFAAQKPLQVTVANRSPERGEALAQRLGGTAIALSSLPAEIHRFDIVVSCTASTLPLIGKGMIGTALRQRRHRPMFLVDLAVPRDIEPEVAELPDVFLHTLDSLGRITDHNSRRRHEEVLKADVIIDTRTAEFESWLRARSVVPLIRQMRSHADHGREIELARARKRLAQGEDPMQVLEAFGLALSNKLLHAPLRALNRAGDCDRDALERALGAHYQPAPPR